MAVDASGPPVRSDVGVMIADAWQGRGVGSALLRALVRRAQTRGATGITMSVLPENRRVLAMISGHWPAAYRDGQPDSVTFCAPITSDDGGRRERGPDDKHRGARSGAHGGLGGTKARAHGRSPAFLAVP